MIVSPVRDVPICHTETEFLTWLSSTDRDGLCFVAAIGGSRGASRLVIHSYLSAMGIQAATLVHPSAWVDSTCRLEVETRYWLWPPSASTCHLGGNLS